MWKQETNTHNYPFQEHFLRTFSNEGPGSVNLSLIRKYSLPEELGAGEELKEMPTEAKPASMNSIMLLAPSFSSSCPSLFHSISELIPNSKTKVPSQVAKNCQIQQSTH